MSAFDRVSECSTALWTTHHDHSNHFETAYRGRNAGPQAAKLRVSPPIAPPPAKPSGALSDPLQALMQAVTPQFAAATLRPLLDLLGVATALNGGLSPAAIVKAAGALAGAKFAQAKKSSETKDPIEWYLAQTGKDRSTETTRWREEGKTTMRDPANPKLVDPLTGQVLKSGEIAARDRLGLATLREIIEIHSAADVSRLPDSAFGDGVDVAAARQKMIAELNTPKGGQAGFNHFDFTPPSSFE